MNNPKKNEEGYTDLTAYYARRTSSEKRQRSSRRTGN